jgi:hypothetical protein
MENLDTFLYIDENQVSMYLPQFSESKKRGKKVKNTYGISLSGPKVEMTVEDETQTLTIYDKVYMLEAILKMRGLVVTQRPKSKNDVENNELKFVHEKTEATKLIFPKNKTEGINGLNHIAVWVSEPNPKHLIVAKNDWDSSGTFLYLTETISDIGVYYSVISGVSALHALYNISHGKNFFDMTTNKNGDEPLERWNFIHPIEKLKSLGAIEIDKRKLETLYRCRYITDEQSYTYKGIKYRTNDLLGYPIYIKER